MIIDEKQVIWQEMSNIYTKEESTMCLTVQHREDEFFCTIWNIKWFKFPHGCILHSKSFPTTPHTPKSEFKRRSYVINKLEKKTSPLANFVTTKPMTKLYCNKTRFSHDKASDKAFLRQNPYFVATELTTNSVATNSDFVATNSVVTTPDFVVTEFVSNSVATKPMFFATKPMTKLSCDKTQILWQQN